MDYNKDAMMEMMLEIQTWDLQTYGKQDKLAFIGQKTNSEKYKMFR